MTRGLPPSLARGFDIETKLDEILSLLRNGISRGREMRPGTAISDVPVFIGTLPTVQTNLASAGVSSRAAPAASLDDAVRRLREIGGVDGASGDSVQEGVGGGV